MPIDILLTGARVYDGLGSAPMVVDVGICGDRLRLVDRGFGDAGEDVEVIDCSGFSLAPGFINVLSHGYPALLVDGTGLSDLSQGVTTLMFGEKMSAAPLTEKRRDSFRRLLDRSAPGGEVTWESVGGFMETLAARGVAQNVCSLVSASAVMECVMADPFRAPSADELVEMSRMIEAEVEAGALGLGTALVYPPEDSLSPAAVLDLAKAAARQGGRYFSHIRGEGSTLLEAVGELIAIGEATQMPCEVWHFKAMGRPNWGLMETAIQLIESARDRGVPVAADMYPYTASARGLWNLIPAEYRHADREKWLTSLEDPTTRSEVIERMHHRVPRPENILLLRFQKDEHRRFEGRTLKDVAEELGLAPGAALVELVLADRFQIGAAFFEIDEENMRLVASLPWVSVGSDGSALTNVEPGAPGVHPRAYGTFARFLGRLARDEQVVSIQEAVRRMTSLPASNLGLHQRGVIADGNFADIFVFDENRVLDNATFESPHRLAEGAHHVIVNGRFALRDGEPTGVLPGRALLRAD